MTVCICEAGRGLGEGEIDSSLFTFIDCQGVVFTSSFISLALFASLRLKVSLPLAFQFSPLPPSPHFLLLHLSLSLSPLVLLGEMDG